MINIIEGQNIILFRNYASSLIDIGIQKHTRLDHINISEILGIAVFEYGDELMFSCGGTMPNGVYFDFENDEYKNKLINAYFVADKMKEYAEYDDRIANSFAEYMFYDYTVSFARKNKEIIKTIIQILNNKKYKKITLTGISGGSVGMIHLLVLLLNILSLYDNDVQKIECNMFAVCGHNFIKEKLNKTLEHLFSNTKIQIDFNFVFGKADAGCYIKDMILTTKEFQNVTYKAARINCSSEQIDSVNFRTVKKMYKNNEYYVQFGHEWASVCTNVFHIKEIELFNGVNECFNAFQLPFCKKQKFFRESKQFMDSKLFEWISKKIHTFNIAMFKINPIFPSLMMLSETAVLLMNDQIDYFEKILSEMCKSENKYEIYKTEVDNFLKSINKINVSNLEELKKVVKYKKLNNMHEKILRKYITYIYEQAEYMQRYKIVKLLLYPTIKLYTFISKHIIKNYNHIFALNITYEMDILKNKIEKNLSDYAYNKQINDCVKSTIEELKSVKNQNLNIFLN